LRWDGVFSRIYEKAVLIEIKKGKKVKIEQIQNYVEKDKAIDRKYDDTISDILFERLNQINWDKVDQIDCSENYYFNINKRGRINSVGMANYRKEDLSLYFGKRDLRKCLKTVYKAVKDLKFDITKHEGKPVSERVTLEVWYEESTGKLQNLSKY